MEGNTIARAADFFTSQCQRSEVAEDKYAALQNDDLHYHQNDSHVNEDAEDKGLVSGHISQPRDKTRSRGFLTSCLGILTIALLCLLSGSLITALLQNYLIRDDIPRSKVLIKPCGGTAAEARARGCHFDIVSFMWLPDQCWDPELVADFEETNHLEWFQGPNRTGPLTRAQVITGEYNPVFVNWEYHWRHCTAMWKKMHRALLSPLGQAAIDGYVAPYHHTLHCEEMFLVNRTKNFEDTDTEVRVKYPDCGMPLL